MLHERKNQIFKGLFDSCLNLQYSKAKDYATDLDALSNFKSQDAEALGLTPFQKWGVYFGKQAMSILGAIGKNPTYPSTISEPIEERIQDLASSTYFIGVSSGLSWLAHSLGCHVFLISDFTPKNHEFTDNVTRIYGKGVREKTF